MYDMKNLAKLKLIDANAPEAMKAFVAFDKAAMADGAIPCQVRKELIARLGVAFTTQCPYCIEIHSGKARQAGAHGCRNRRGGARRRRPARRRCGHARHTCPEGSRW